MQSSHTFMVRLYDESEPVIVKAFEMDVQDGALVFMGANRGGYIAAYAPSHWVSVTPVEEKTW